MALNYLRSAFAACIAVVCSLSLTACDDRSQQIPPATVQPTAASEPAASPTSTSPTSTALVDPLALIDAASSGDAATVRGLLTRGVPVNVRDARGLTPVMAASRNGHVEATKLLVAAGADVNAKDDSQENAFSIAAINGHLEVLRLTIAAGADPNARNRFDGTALIAASDRGHVAIVRELLTTNVDIDHGNRLGWTALLEAVILGDGGPNHTEIVRLLVAARANVNIADHDGVTPLQHARNRGYTSMIEVLVNAGGR